MNTHGASIHSENKLPEESEEQKSESLNFSRSKQVFKIAGWIFFTIFCLIFFTLLKLPEDRIKSFVDYQISTQLASQGMTYSSKESKLSLFFGLHYKMKDVTLNFPPPTRAVAKIDEIDLSPSLLSLLFGKTAGTLNLRLNDGTLNSSFSAKNSQISFSFEAKKLDLGKLGLFAILANMQGSAVISGSGTFSGNTLIPSTWDGGFSIQLSHILLDQQLAYGFNFPKISISEGVIDLNFDKSKAVIETFRLGKAKGGTAGATQDDIQGNISGNVLLAKSWDASQCNIQIHFSLSDEILKSFILLDALLGSGKQPDGSYAFEMKGSLNRAMPVPLKLGQ